MHALAKPKLNKQHVLICDHLDMALRLARKIARRVPQAVRRDDLESAAFLGLTEAASRYDSTRSEPFAAYASKRVRGAVLDELRRNDILTRRGREGAKRIADAATAVQARVGRPATTQEIANHLNLPLNEIQEARGRLAPTLVPLDETRDCPKNVAFTRPDEQVADCQRKELVIAALQTLGQRDLQILSMYFEDELTLKEIGLIMGISESRVSQLRSRAFARLRKVIATEPKASI